MTSVTIPNSVTSIGSYAFEGCSGLTDVYCYWEKMPTFFPFPTNPSVTSNATLHVPAALLDDYQSDSSWRRLFKEIVPLQSYLLTYMVDGEEYLTVEVREGLPLTAEAEPTKEGHLFSGWSEIPETMPAKDVTVTGAFTLQKYLVTYMVDGKVYKSYDALWGQPIPQEDEPTQTGYTFSGWQREWVDVTDSYIVNPRYDDNDITTGWEGYPPFGAASPAENAEQYHRVFNNFQQIKGLTPGKYRLSLNAFYRRGLWDDDYAAYSSGDYAQEQHAKFYAETALGKVESPIVLASSALLKSPLEGQYRIVGDGLYMPYNMEAAHHWFEAGYYENSLECEVGDDGCLTIGIYKDVIIDSDWVCLDNWKLEMPATGDMMPAHDVIFSGSFVVNTYTLTYLLDGEVYKSMDIHYGTPLTAEAEPTKEGYLFSGWSEIPETMPAQGWVVKGVFRSVENRLAAQAQSVYLGESAVVNVDLVNVVPLVACQFEVVLPEGIDLQGCELTSRAADDHHVQFSKRGGGVYRVKVISDSSQAFGGTEGALLRLTLSTNHTAGAGEHAISLQNVELTTQDATPIISVEANAVLTLKEVIAGDANGDGVVTVPDVVAIVNHIIGKTPAVFVEVMADATGDGQIDVADVTQTVNIILGPGDDAEARVRGVEDGFGGSVLVVRERGGMRLLLDEAERYMAMQFTVVVPEGCVLSDVALNCGSDHAVAYSQTGENRYTVVVYSMSNAAFAPTEAALLTLSLSGGGATVEEAKAITAEGLRRVLLHVEEGATGIATVKGGEADAAVYNLSGLRVGDDVHHLPQGVYIRGGKKVVVRKRR